MIEERYCITESEVAMMQGMCKGRDPLMVHLYGLTHKSNVQTLGIKLTLGRGEQ